MFKFLFGKRGSVKSVAETQRGTFERLVTELNDAIDGLPDKPKVTLDPASGHLSFELPEVFPDEALALPAPEADASEETPTTAPDTVTAADKQVA